MVFLKALVNGKVIGCIRGYQTNETAHILRLIVHPFFQGRGLGSRLVLAMEQRFPEARRFEAFTGHRSRRNLHLYNKLGYRAFDTRSASETLQWVYLQKARP
jgi:ribosomal protein S18 acetylase RimI-like enzyme